MPMQRAEHQILEWNSRDQAAFSRVPQQWPVWDLNWQPLHSYPVPVALSMAPETTRCTGAQKGGSMARDQTVGFRCGGNHQCGRRTMGVRVGTDQSTEERVEATGTEGRKGDCGYRYTARPKKKLHTLIFCWTAFCFDYSAHLLWRCFDNLMQRHNILY